jgi:hypothetical protein
MIMVATIVPLLELHEVPIDVRRSNRRVILLAEAFFQAFKKSPVSIIYARLK